MKKMRVPSRRDLRFVSGLVLFTYLTTHMFNHSLGLVSLNAAERGLDVATWVWQSPAGTLLLYGAALTHIALALHSIYQRRTLRMPFGDLFRIVLGLNLPILLIAHAASTRLASEFYNYTPYYADVVRDIWAAGSQWRQFAILAPGWVHGCLGLQAALGRRGWWRAALPVLFGVFLVLPILSALGFVEMQRELTRFGTLAPPGEGPTAATRAAIAAWRDRAVDIYVGLVVMVFAARAGRWAYERARGAVVEIGYPGRTVLAPRGWSVLEASRANHIPHPSACGGRARCSTCRVRVLKGLDHCPLPQGDEAITLARIGAAPDLRLACQLRPQGPVSVLPLFGANKAPAVSRGGEAQYAVMFVDLVERRELAEALLPQDLKWVLSALLQAVEKSVRDGQGHVLHLAQDHVCAAFRADRDPAGACRKALRAAHALGEAITGMCNGLDDDWRASLQVHVALHIGAVLIDPTELEMPNSRMVIAVGPAIDEIESMRSTRAARRGGLAASDVLLHFAGEDPERWGANLEAPGISSRVRKYIG
jgi:adenylate cyclase